MKLLKKLIPLVTLVTTSATMVPVISACGGSSSSDTWKPGEEYEPSIKEADLPTGEYTEEEMSSKYFTDAAANNTIVKDDVMKGISDFFQDQTTIQSISVNIDNVDANNKTISGSTVVKTKYNNKTYNVNGTITKVPFKVAYDVNRFYLVVDTSRVKETTWSVKLTGDMEETYNSTTDNIASIAKNLAENYAIPSYYLSKCTLKGVPEPVYDWVDLTQPYSPITPTITTKTELSSNEATDLYFKYLTSNSQIYINDFCVNLKKLFSGSGVELTTLKVGFSSLNVDSTNHTLSFRFKSDINAKFNSTNADESIFDIEQDLLVSNVPYLIDSHETASETFGTCIMPKVDSNESSGKYFKDFGSGYIEGKTTGYIKADGYTIPFSGKTVKFDKDSTISSEEETGLGYFCFTFSICNSNYFQNVNVTSDELVDVTKKYVPKISAKSETTVADEAAALDLYLYEVNKYPQILKDDSYWTNWKICEQVQTIAPFTKNNIKVTDISVDVSNKTWSFKYVNEIYETFDAGNYDYTIELECTNVPMVATYNSGGSISKWTLGNEVKATSTPFSTWGDGKIVGKMTGSITTSEGKQTFAGETVTINKDSTEATHTSFDQKWIYSSAQSMFIYSAYFGNIKIS